jgi:hypothetical protein
MEIVKMTKAEEDYVKLRVFKLWPKSQRLFP